MTLTISPAEVERAATARERRGTFSANVRDGAARAPLRRRLETRLAAIARGKLSAVAAEARVEFSLPALAENVALVRHALAGLAEALAWSPRRSPT